VGTLQQGGQKGAGWGLDKMLTVCILWFQKHVNATNTHAYTHRFNA